VPELPEVEVTRRRLAPLLVGRKIARVETTAPSYFFLTKPHVLKKRLAGRKVLALVRHGKYLIAELDDQSRLLLHLGMTGQLFAAGVKSLRLLSAAKRSSLAPEQQVQFTPDEHTHLQFHFTDKGPVVFFRDVRKFGKCLWLPAGKMDPRLDKLGVDALLATGEALYEVARRRSIPIKSLLLDQATLAGVGNIYADEALFLAKVKPTRVARRVTLRECASIVAAAQRVMLRSIETGGSSISDYVQPDGTDGGYQNERHVYGREGEPCPLCKTPLVRIVIGQRSTHFCARCQT
jgi:formamidopyrimidine-DNA glycosylase